MMPKDNVPTISRLTYSEYRMRPHDDSVFGEFDCRILGQEVIVTVERREDRDPHVRDILGFPMRRRCAAIHISGKRDNGTMDHGGFIQELGWWSVRAAEAGSEVKFSPREPHAVAIVMNPTDPDEPHAGKLHMVQWEGGAEYYLTMDGLYAIAGGWRFRPEEVLARINENPMRQGRIPLEGAQHLRAIRRLLEQMCGVSNISSAQWENRMATLERGSRWSYAFREC